MGLIDNGDPSVLMPDGSSTTTRSLRRYTYLHTIIPSVYNHYLISDPDYVSKTSQVNTLRLRANLWARAVYIKADDTWSQHSWWGVRHLLPRYSWDYIESLRPRVTVVSWCRPMYCWHAKGLSCSCAFISLGKVSWPRVRGWPTGYHEMKPNLCLLTELHTHMPQRSIDIILRGWNQEWIDQTSIYIHSMILEGLWMERSFEGRVSVQG
jgi:hypothetical protein